MNDIIEDIRQRRIEHYNGIHHNGNDHSRGPLSNCPGCATDVLLAELDACRRDLAEERARTSRLTEVVEHVIRNGYLGKQSARRLREALADCGAGTEQPA